MKILWLVNIAMPDLAVELGETPSVFGGWLNGAMEAVKNSGAQLVVCTTRANSKEEGSYDINGVRYYITDNTDRKHMSNAFREILDKEAPDVVHLYGTEFEHTWVMAEQAQANKTLVSVQGLVSYYSEHVFGGVPDTVARDSLYHRILRKIKKGGTSIELQRQSYLARSQAEINTLKKVKYVNGGTAWGDACAKLLQPDVTLFDCGLILRESYYDGRMWDYDKCEKHSIFTIYTYPIKGFDMFLKALKIVVERYPDTKVYVAGNECTYKSYSPLKRFIMNKAPDYDWYVQGLIEKYNLKDNIVFMGYMSEEQMHNKLLESNVFASCSLIENHSTALGEAMISGTPSVASCVGGLQEMINHGEDGFLYPFNETYMLAYYICELFENTELAKQFSVKGHEHAGKTYNREGNTQKLLKMYETIIADNREDK